MSAPAVAVDRDGAVALVTMDNPPVNAMAEPLLVQLGEAVRGLGADPGVRAVVLTGAGEKAFAAGAELPELGEIRRDPEALRAHVALTRSVLDGLAALPQPLIAAVAGAALGGGLELLLTCDLAVVEGGCKLGLPEVRLGLMPGAGGTQRLSRRIGPAASTELIMRGRLIDPEEALQLGLITEVTAPGDGVGRARELAAELAAGPSLALRAIKRAIREGAELPLAAALDLEREQFVAVAQSEDAGIGIDAFLARERASFTQK